MYTYRHVPIMSSVNIAFSQWDTVYAGLVDRNSSGMMLKLILN